MCRVGRRWRRQHCPGLYGRVRFQRARSRWQSRSLQTSPGRSSPYQPGAAVPGWHVGRQPRPGQPEGAKRAVTVNRTGAANIDFEVREFTSASAVGRDFGAPQGRTPAKGGMARSKAQPHRTRPRLRACLWGDVRLQFIPTAI